MKFQEQQRTIITPCILKKKINQNWFYVYAFHIYRLYMLFILILSWLEFLIRINKIQK